tara:strand:+ start:63 stop:425 length:363 start_codon:yes stop_codon:yes gene_type:complete
MAHFKTNKNMKYTFVEIVDKKYPVKFGFNALRKYGIKTNTSLADLDKLGQDMHLNDALTLILCGIEDGFRAAKQKCELDIDSLSDLIDEDFSAIERCMAVLGEQMGGKEGKQKASKTKKR